MGGLPAVRNYWPDAKCAKAFWSQQEVRPYRRLLADTIAWCAPAAGERWLDLGCGSGPLSRALWERSNGSVEEVLGIDCAAVNAEAYARLRADLTPPPGDRVRFLCHDFSGGLDPLPDDSFDHAVSGLSITYAESYSEAEGRWTTDAYETVLADVWRVLRPGGRFVFSVNVPEPRWWKVALFSLGDVVRAGRPLQFLKRSLRMMKYGAWLKREARTGRFHYLPAAAVSEKLAAAGFTRIEHRVSYAGQAFVFRCVKPRRG
jgi:ubiquinone/menaquinone biosynthesis C-methylase UbiE